MTFYTKCKCNAGLNRFEFTMLYICMSLKTISKVLKENYISLYK